MRPDRIMFIRHAEKPTPDEGIGIEADGKPDAESLCVRGWQRAGALARFFCPIEKAHAAQLKPATVFAAGAGPSSKSKRSMQTVTPLVSLLRVASQVDYVDTYLKDDGRALMTDVLTRAGVVLIAWEHKVLPPLIGHLPRAPTVPAAWPDDRFDVVWIFDRAGESWSFSQLPQLLLAGDSTTPIG
ncbi:phosphoglycerate mutase family protein [Paraburkholderia acidiphila]|uniref:Phosphoglycerate mutase family protein n=2 Tax=Paraburkholderia acidiphila TaxID=2571747 RepID=A0A7Z2GE65_9BURK|nr:phosphoglycerate mutase family protein [Paraburkholderia acidiphila]